MAYIHKMIQSFHAGIPQRENRGLAVGRTGLEISTLKDKVNQLFSSSSYVASGIRPCVEGWARVDINSPRGRVATWQGCPETGLTDEDVGMNRVWIDPD
jgi:hypothetical protein